MIDTTTSRDAFIDSILSKYETIDYSPEIIQGKLDKLQNSEHKYKTKDYYKKMFSLIDLTTLNTQDSTEKVIKMCSKVNAFNTIFRAIPLMGAICIYPPFAETVKKNLRVQGVGIASVSAGFPSSQTYIEVKALESQMVVNMGATEVDIVISVGTFLSGDLWTVYQEIRKIKASVEPAHLKVILETGALKDPNLIRVASIIAMEAGADFIKTSTGKLEPAATPEAILVMCEAIREFNLMYKRQIGIKPAGGLVTADDATKYFTIIVEILGEAYESNRLLRFGASRLANNLLTTILGDEIIYF